MGLKVAGGMTSSLKNNLVALLGSGSPESTTHLQLPQPETLYLLIPLVFDVQERRKYRIVPSCTPKMYAVLLTSSFSEDLNLCFSL